MDDFRREFFVCECTDVSHQLAMGFWQDDEQPAVFCEILLNPHRSFFGRVITAIRYVFAPRECRYGAFEEVVFQNGDADRLQEIVDYLKGKKVKEGKNGRRDVGRKAGLCDIGPAVGGNKFS